MSFFCTARLRPLNKFVALLLLTGLVAVAHPATAHEGHDHGDEKRATPAAGEARPRAAAESELFELLAERDGGTLRLHLDRYADNAPVVGAKLAVAIDGAASMAATEASPGVYEVALASGKDAAALDLVVSVEAAADVDVLTLTLPPAMAGAAEVVANKTGRDMAWALGAGLLFAGFAAGGLIGRIGRRSAAAAFLLLSLAAIQPALAHEGHDHGEEKLPPVTGDIPRRLPDGSLFLPKPVQRLLEIRTQPAAIVEMIAETRRLPAVALADPARIARVQALQAGRIEVAQEVLPMVGQRIERGQLIAYVQPSVPTADLGSMRRDLAAIDKDIVLAEQRYQRVSRIPDAVPRREIEDAEATLAGLRRQRTALAPSLREREALRAPISGIVSIANVVPGQVVESREVLFEVVDPSSLVVEALIAEPDAALLRSSDRASALFGDGARAPLEFIGVSPTLRGQSAVLLFRLRAAELRPGTPLNVDIETARRLTGIALPRAAVQRDGGEIMVWVKEGAERFRRVPVRLAGQANGQSVVAAGLQPGQRVVTAGANLLAAYR